MVHVEETRRKVCDSRIVVVYLSMACLNVGHSCRRRAIPVFVGFHVFWSLGTKNFRRSTQRKRIWSAIHAMHRRNACNMPRPRPQTVCAAGHRFGRDTVGTMPIEQGAAFLVPLSSIDILSFFLLSLSDLSLPILNVFMLMSNKLIMTREHIRQSFCSRECY